MFTLYCDDSGTHNESEWAIAASIIAPAGQWEKFREAWQRIAKDENFDVFHMATFVARKPSCRAYKPLGALIVILIIAMTTALMMTLAMSIAIEIL